MNRRIRADDTGSPTDFSGAIARLFIPALLVMFALISLPPAVSGRLRA